MGEGRKNSFFGKKLGIWGCIKHCEPFMSTAQVFGIPTLKEDTQKIQREAVCLLLVVLVNAQCYRDASRTQM